VNWL